MARTIHYDPSTQTNSCMQCGRTTYGMSLSHSECPDCKTVELAQEQNRLIEAEHQRRAKEREEESNREYLRDRAAKKASREAAGVSDPWNGFIVATVRLFIVFMLVSWLLPQKIEGISMVLAVAIVLAVDKFQPDLSEFTALSPTERLVHWVLLVGSIGSAIVG